MEYKRFIEKITEAVSMEMGSHTEISVRQVQKNNGVVLDGLLMKRPESNLTPTIYLNSFYEEYEAGRPFVSILREIKRIYEEKSLKHSVDMTFFRDYEQIKAGIFYKLIHYEKNREFLKEVPHIPFLDLAIVFYYAMSNEIMGNGNIQICNEHLPMWKVTTEELFRQADKNTQKQQKYEIKSMVQILDELFAGCPYERTEYRESEKNIPMYVLSNQHRSYGAVSILYHHLLQDFAGELGKNLYILPSSVHEVILIPDFAYEQPGQFEKMVQEINATQLETEEVLSDSVYYYDRQENKITVFTKN